MSTGFFKGLEDNKTLVWRRAQAHGHAVNVDSSAESCGFVDFFVDLLLVFPLSLVQQPIEGTPLGSEALRPVPQRSLSAVEEFEEVAALGGAQKLCVLGDKALDIERDILQLWPDIFLQDVFRFLE